MNMGHKQKVKEIHYHRNGISGNGFYVAIVKSSENGRTSDMLVIRFPDIDKDTGGVVCAAFDLAMLDKREIRFCYNSFRGDHFHECMDKAIAEKNKPTSKV